MQPGRARTSGLGLPPLPLARCLGWVAPVRPTHGVLVLSCPSAALRVHMCAVSWATWLLLAGVPARCVVSHVRHPGQPGSRSLVCPLGALLRVRGVLDHLAPAHRCSRSVRCFARAASWATWLLFTSVPAWFVVLRVRCPGPLGSCSPVRPLSALLCSCGVLDHFAPVHRCARSVCSVACVVSWAIWLLFASVPARCFVLCCVFGVLGHLAPVHRCACSVLCFACAVSLASSLLFTVVPAWFVVLRVRCPGPLGSCSLVCPLGVLCCVYGVLGPLPPLHRCARSVFCVACVVSCATWLLFTGVCARCVVSRVRCPVPVGSCSLLCPLSVLCCVTVSWASWLLSTGLPPRCVVLRVRCPGPLGPCSPMCPLGVLCCVCGVLGPLAPLHQRAGSVCCVACAVSCATSLLFTGVLA